MDSLYTIEIFDFLKTVTIKGSFIGDQIVSTIKNKYNIDITDDEFNPYYINMCGEYSQFDTKIYIESIDTNSQILFSKDNLLLHPKTAKKYKLPDKKLKELCSLYPKQQHLIESIVYPVDNINTAINAKNFEILSYDSSLLQTNEVDSLIQCLYDTVEIFKTNFYIEEFFYENTYPIVMWDFMWKYLYFALYKQRISNIKTPSVHINHIWSYLTSKGLNDYRSILSIEQQYWLYKNIDYLFRNQGKNSNLQLLAENILSSYSVELKQKSIFLNYKEGILSPEPIPEVISEDIYTETNPSQNLGVKYESLPTLIEREFDNNLRPTNDIDIVNYAHNKFTRNFSTYHPTRVIEINKKPMWVDYESLYVRFIIENYIYRYKEGDLNYKILVELNTVGSSKILTVGECFALFNYCLHLQQNRNEEYDINTSDIIPNSLYTDVPKVPIKIPSNVYVDTVFVKDCNPQNMSMVFKNIRYVNIEKKLHKLITIPNVDYSTPESFMEFLEDRFNILYKTSLIERSLADEFFYNIVENVYKPFVLKGKLNITLVDGYNTYNEWFNSNSELNNIRIGLLNTSEQDLEVFMLSLVEKMFPTYINYNIIKSKVLLNDKYTKLKKLFTKLCSYTISFLDTQDNDDINCLTIANTTHSNINITNNYILPMSTKVDISNKIISNIDTPIYTSMSDKVFGNTVFDISIVERDESEEFVVTPTVTTYSIRNDIKMDVTNSLTNIKFIQITTAEEMVMEDISSSLPQNFVLDPNTILTDDDYNKILIQNDYDTILGA